MTGLSWRGWKPYPGIRKPLYIAYARSDRHTFGGYTIREAMNGVSVEVGYTSADNSYVREDIAYFPSAERAKQAAHKHLTTPLAQDVSLQDC